MTVVSVPSFEQFLPYIHCYSLTVAVNKYFPRFTSLANQTQMGEISVKNYNYKLKKKNRIPAARESRWTTLRPEFCKKFSRIAFWGRARSH